MKQTTINPSKERKLFESYLNDRYSNRFESDDIKPLSIEIREIVREIVIRVVRD